MTPETLILDELQRLGIYYKIQGENFVVKCLWHEDHTPSLSLHKSGTKARCWGCPWTGTWNMYAREIGAKTINRDELNLGYMVDEDIKSAKTGVDDPFYSPVEGGVSGSGVVIPNSANILYNKSWRGISSEFLSRLDARIWYDDEAEANRILLPVKGIKNKTQGWIAAKEDPTDKSISLKYRNMKDMPISRVLYPINLLTGDSAVIVEGPFDAIRLCEKGIPGLAICGVENWTSKKALILHAKGVTKIFLAMDGDEAGRKAANKIAAELEDEFDVTIVDLPVGKDPGDVGDWFIDWLHDLIF